MPIGVGSTLAIRRTGLKKSPIKTDTQQRCLKSGDHGRDDRRTSPDDYVADELNRRQVPGGWYGGGVQNPMPFMLHSRLTRPNPHRKPIISGAIDISSAGTGANGYVTAT